MCACLCLCGSGHVRIHHALPCDKNMPPCRVLACALQARPGHRLRSRQPRRAQRAGSAGRAAPAQPALRLWAAAANHGAPWQCPEHLPAVPTQRRAGFATTCLEPAVAAATATCPAAALGCCTDRHSRARRAPATCLDRSAAPAASAAAGAGAAAAAATRPTGAPGRKWDGGRYAPKGCLLEFPAAAAAAATQAAGAA